MSNKNKFNDVLNFSYIYRKFIIMPVPIITYTLEQYQAISNAIAEGVTKVQYGDKTVEYRSLEEMLRIQSLMYSQLFPCVAKNNGRRYFGVSKGTSCNRRNFNRD